MNRAKRTIDALGRQNASIEEQLLKRRSRSRNDNVGLSNENIHENSMPRDTRFPPQTLFQYIGGRLDYNQELLHQEIDTGR